MRDGPSEAFWRCGLHTSAGGLYLSSFQNLQVCFLVCVAWSKLSSQIQEASSPGQVVSLSPRLHLWTVLGLKVLEHGLQVWP